MSVVSAVYDVRRYLDEFIDCLEAQTLPWDELEIVLVDDGSTDGSLERLRKWEQERPGHVRVLSQANAGQGAARNAGLREARGRWVGFIDPDDTVAPDYLENLADLGDRTEADMAVGRLLVLDDATGLLADTHPLRHRFTDRDRAVDLETSPAFYHLHIASSLLRRAELAARGLEFDPALRPNFEDGHLIARYLLGRPHPRVAYASSTAYHYRRRADGTSTLQKSLMDPRKYTTVLERGYLDVLRSAVDSEGRVPEWVQNMIVYELGWLLRPDEVVHAQPNAESAGVAECFHDLVAEICTYLEPDVVDRFPSFALPQTRAAALMFGYRDQDWFRPWVWLDRYDARRRLVRMRYLFTGEQPREVLRLRGRPAAPRHAKTRYVRYSGKVLAKERILWVSTRGSIALTLDGTSVPLLRTPPRRPHHRWRPDELAASFERRRATPPERPSARIRFQRWLVRTLGDSGPVKRRYAGSWVLMDRDVAAGDNAEALFDHLRRERPGIPAWFALRRGGSGWSRLRRSAGRRVVRYGSLRWALLCRNADVIASSHAERYVYDPREFAGGIEPRWRFVFLSHGILQSDLSRWLETKPIDIMVATTPDEFAHLTGDGGPGLVTTKEVVRTGLPRYDRLLARAVDRAAPPDRVLVVPTWREFLVLTTAGTGARALRPDAADSDFVAQWGALLRNPELGRVCSDQGLTLTFLPHPNLCGIASVMDLPGHVDVRDFGSVDVQELLASTRTLVTDYSSVAFDAAALRRQVAYFQFDRAAMFSGGHTTRSGYFDYERDGFGPVATDIATTVENLIPLLTGSPEPAPEYLARIDAAFDLIDGQSCARVTQAVMGRARPRGLRHKSEPDSAPRSPDADAPAERDAI